MKLRNIKWHIANPHIVLLIIYQNVNGTKIMNEDLKIYDAFVAKCNRFERKGKTMP